MSFVSGTFSGVFQCKHCKTRAVAFSISPRFAARVIASALCRYTDRRICLDRRSWFGYALSELVERLQQPTAHASATMAAATFGTMQTSATDRAPTEQSKKAGCRNVTELWVQEKTQTTTTIRSESGQNYDQTSARNTFFKTISSIASRFPLPSLRLCSRRPLARHTCSRWMT